MHRARQVFIWIRKRWLPLWISCAFFVNGLISIASVQPFWERLVVSLVTLGFLTAPSGLFYSLISTEPVTQFQYMTVSLVGQVGMPFGAVLELTAVSALIAWGLRRITQAEGVNRVLQVVFCLNLLLAWITLFLVVADESNRYMMRASCDLTISKTVGIRVHYYADLSIEDQSRFAAIPASQDTRYWMTQDGGQTWRHFLTLTSWRGSCAHVNTAGEGFFWLYEWGAFIFTHDSGQTWGVWTVNQVQKSFQENWEEVSRSRITAVTFQDQSHGRMTLEYFDYESQKSQEYSLYTTDGGLTWHLPGES